MATSIVIKKASMGTTSLLVGAALTGMGLSYLWRRSLEPDDEKMNQTLFPMPVDVTAFRSAKLVSAKNVGAGAKVLRFKYENGPGIHPLRPFSHLQVRGVTTDVPPEYPFGLKVERPYTPIMASRNEFELLVKSYPKDEKDKANARKGLTSRFLLSLEPGQTVEVKGPIPTFEDEGMREALATRKFVGMVCGGSGITPMIQLLSRLSSADASRRFSLLWSNHTAEDMFYRKELEHMTKGMKNVNIRYTLTRMTPSGWLHDTGRVSKELLRARMPPPSPECIIVVCGPESFVEAVAGGKRGADGKWRGPIGGFLKELDYTNEHVLRL